MRRVLICLLACLAFPAQSGAHIIRVKIGPPTLKIIDSRGEIDSTAVIAGVAFGSPWAATSFPTFTVGGLMPQDRIVCVTIRDDGKHHEWSFVWRRDTNSHLEDQDRITFELVRAGQRPAGGLAVEAAIAATASSSDTCGPTSPYLPAWWASSPHMPQPGALLVNSQGATNVWLDAGQTRTPCSKLGPGPDGVKQNWTAYDASCPVPRIACGRIEPVAVQRSRGEAFAVPIPLNLRGPC